MKLKFSLLILLFTFSGILYAQTDFRPGFVITNSLDTLHGTIDYRSDLAMSSNCRFKDDDGKVTDFTPNDIAAFRFADSKYFVSREVEGKKVFLEYLIKGMVNVYYMRDDMGDHYLLDREDKPLTRIPYERGVRVVDNKSIHYESTLHIGLLKYFMHDAPQLESSIARIKRLEHRRLIRLAENYHNLVCQDEECIVYEKREPLFKVNLEVVGGVVNFENVADLNDKYYPQGGIIANIWMPRTHENLYFRTGFLYAQVEQSGKKKHHLKVPTHIGYMTPSTYRVRSSLSIGLFTPSYSGGVAVKVGNSINLGVQGWVNFFGKDKLFIIPHKLFNYSILASFYIEL